MSYGQGSYGGTPYAGYALSSGGPQLVSTDPAIDASGVPVNATVAFVVASDADLDLFTLNVTVDGNPAVLAGVFVGAYNGSIYVAPNPGPIGTPGTYALVTISTHPDFADGRPLLIHIEVSDVATVSGSFTYTLFTGNANVPLAESVAVAEALVTRQGTRPIVTETVTVTESGEEDGSNVAVVYETVAIAEHLQGAAPTNLDSYTILLPLTQQVQYDGVCDYTKYVIRPTDGGVPIDVVDAYPEVDVIGSGTGGSVGDPDEGTFFTHVLNLPGSFTSQNLGDYIEVTGPASSPNLGVMARISAILSPASVQVDNTLVATDTSALTWTHTTAVRRMVLTTTKPTNNRNYAITYQGLKQKVSGLPITRHDNLLTVVDHPRLSAVEFLPNGFVLVTFSEEMRADSGIVRIEDYTITGPTAVQIRSASQVSPTQVLLRTVGMGAGTYTLTINASGTPHDIAGNPIDASFNLGTFSGSVPLDARSIFVDKGPIAKPPLTLQSGTGASVVSVTDVSCPGASFTTTAIGHYLSLSGGTTNGGTFLVTGVVSATRVRVQASFSLPDPAAGTLAWTLFDPRHGQIADNATDVVVRINGVPTQASNVIGLLGQIVMPTAPPHSADVRVDYSWVRDPMVEIRALNNTQFALNSRRRTDPLTQHTYAYRCVLTRPENFVPPVTVQSGINAAVYSSTQFQLPGASLSSANVGMRLTISLGVNAGDHVIAGVTSGNIVTIVGALTADATLSPWTVVDPKDDFQAALAAPLQRDVKYRAYERAYTALLNDPNLLLLNSPSQKIAFPPLSRPIDSTFLRYEATVLPESDPTNPWTRVGTGTAVISSNQLVVGDNTGGPFPSGNPIFWTRPVDLTFDHVFAAAWRCLINADPIPQGVFTGVAVGYSDDLRAAIVGFLDDGGVKKIGFLKKGYGNDPSDISAWSGGIDGSGNATGAPFEFDWSILHSYRIYRDLSGILRLYVDGEVVESLRLVEADLPFLEELDDPFLALQGVFFGSISRPAENTSTWSFLSYTVLPTNPTQTAPSSFVSYEATQPPEESTPPWTPIGYHGNETIIGSSVLLVDSTSATTEATEALVGLVGGDFRGYMKIEPLLIASSDVVLDIGAQLRTFTHGIAPNAMMAAIDDGDRLIQLCFFPDHASSKYSYGGRCLPENATPTAWTPMGTATATMVGRTLRITDALVGSGKVYYVDDTNLPHVVATSGSYIMEIRVQVRSYTVDGTGFAGITAQTYDLGRSVGILLQDVSGTRYVTFHSDGVPLLGGQFAFEWFDGKPHTYRFVVVPGSNVVSVFADAVLLGTMPYTSFSIPAPVANGVISWGSATSSSTGALSVVDWFYANAWQVYSNPKRFAGIWKGTSTGTLVDYHLPTKTQGRNALVIGNALGDGAADFVAAGVVAGDYLIVDDGPNKGVYLIASVASMALTVDVSTPFPVQPSRVTYRIPAQVDWSIQHTYRLVRDPGGGVALFLDGAAAPIIQLGYNNLDLPSSLAGIVRKISGGLPAIAFGAFDPTNLSQSSWDFVRFGIVRSPVELRTVPPHQILNQRNTISSPEHLTAMVAHPHTGFWSSSTGIPPQTAPDFLQDATIAAYTRLNQGTPPMLLTQTSEVRHPVPTLVPISGLNRPEDVLNNNGPFILNNATSQIRLIVPDDVLYNSLQLVETITGDSDILAPFDDSFSDLGTLSYQNRVCLVYDGTALPENTLSPTPWTIQSDNPSEVSRSAFAGVLTYGTLGVGTKTAYRNMTPLPDAPGLQTQILFRIRLLNDASGGLGDSQVRFGFSAPGLTFGLGLVTVVTGERYVLVYDMNSLTIVGGLPFDFLDGLFHDYRIVRDPSAGTVQLFIDS